MGTGADDARFWLMNMVARHVRISGKVQGVFYRGWTVQTAQALGLAGWVRNRSDGDVEAFVQGPAGDVERFLFLAWSGPSAARVEAVEIEEIEPQELRTFEQRPTA